MADSPNKEKNTLQPHFDYGLWYKADKPQDPERIREFITTGFDMFATVDYFYIVRSDLDHPVFMRIGGLHDPKYKGKIYELPTGYQNGDYYFGDNGIKYMVKGDIMHSSADMSTDTGSIKNVMLPDDLKDGMHYCIKGSNFYKIKDSRVYIYKNWQYGTKDVTEQLIHEDLRKAIAYFVLNDYFYVVKMVDTGGGDMVPCFYKVKNLVDDPGLTYKTINKHIVPFLPGGYALDSPSEVVWQQIGTIENQTDQTLDYVHDFKYSHGHDKTHTHEREHHWDFTFEQSYQTGAEIARYNFKATQNYGGSDKHINTSEWSTSTEETIQLSFTIEPGKKVAIFQPTGSLQNDTSPLITGRNLVVTNGEEPNHEPWG